MVAFAHTLSVMKSILVSCTTRQMQWIVREDWRLPHSPSIIPPHQVTSTSFTAYTLRSLTYTQTAIGNKPEDMVSLRLFSSTVLYLVECSYTGCPTYSIHHSLHYKLKYLRRLKIFISESTIVSIISELFQEC